MPPYLVPYASIEPVAPPLVFGRPFEFRSVGRPGTERALLVAVLDAD